jgi:Antibiotic biosynthesis monooxygenase
MLQLREMDDRVPLADQLSEEVGPVILINTFRVAPEDVDTLLEAWAADAAYLKQQPGFISPSCTAASLAAGCSSTTRSGSRWRPSGTRSVIPSSRRPSPATPTPRWPPPTCSRR